MGMMRQYELVDRVKRYNPNTDEELLNRAYVYAMRAHGTQKRASGDPFFAHPLEVAAILTELKLDDANDGRIDDFIRALRLNNTQEQGAVCSGGITDASPTPFDIGNGMS